MSAHRRTRAVGLLAFALLATSVVLPTLVGLLAVELTGDLGFGDRGLGLAISCFWFVTAVAAPLCGRWVDRCGWLPGAMGGALVVLACLVACVLLVHSWSALLVVLAIAGLGYALCSPTSNLLVVTAAPRRRQASVLGFKQTAPPLITALAGATLPALAHVHGWRPAVAAGLVLPVAALVGTMVVGRARPREVSDVPGGPRGTSDRSGAAEPLRPVPVVLAAGLGTLSVATVTGFAVLTLVGVGIAPVTAAAVVSGGSLLAVLARIFAGAFLDARPAGDLLPLVALMAAAVIGLAVTAAGLLAAQASPAPVWVAVVAVGVVVSLVAAWTWPALLLLAVVRRADGAGAASGLLQLGSGVGSAVGPLGFGVLSEAGGRGLAWLLMAGGTALAILLVRRAVRCPRRELVHAEGVTAATDSDNSNKELSRG